MVFTRHSIVKDQVVSPISKDTEYQFQNEISHRSPSPKGKRQKTENNFVDYDNHEDITACEEVNPKESGSRRSSRQNKSTISFKEDHSSEEFIQEPSTSNRRTNSVGRPRQQSKINGHVGAGVGKGGKHRSHEMVETTQKTSCVDEEEEESHPIRKSLRQTNNLSILRDDSPEKEAPGDMYTRIKRMRRAASMRAAGRLSLEQSMRTPQRLRTEHKKTNANTKEDEDEDTDEDDNNRRYPVRERRQAEIFSANRDLYRPRRQEKWFNESFSSPKKSRSHSFHRHRRKRRVSNSSTTSSSSSSSDETRFERRKAKSMQRSRNRFLPINFSSDDIKSGVLHAKNKAGGASLADVDPMIIDSSITFDSVGGLTNQIQALKEAVVLPLVYPEVFSHLNIEPPRGILFYGPPGTGKTLLARALSNECGKLGQRVAFFMRKGADCLSKWVGESERQLRLLFDQAFRMRPSIIFFDEIDGLAPVRSSKQDQIHASIVSTLLGLIDGLDQRGHVVVIGATNRLDSIDPALRRPGRFDREFLFTLPSEAVRTDIMRLAMTSWKPPPPESLLESLSKKTQGFTGADLKALVREAGLCALRRRYPQIYSAKEKLLLKMSEIKPQEEDFVTALSVVRPSGQRSANTLSRPLTSSFHSLLGSTLEKVYESIGHIFPVITEKSIDPFNRFTSANNTTETNRDDYSLTLSGHADNDMVHSLSDSINLLRPRLLVHGPGLSDHLMAAIFHQLDGVQIFPMDLTSMYSNSSSSVEESISMLMINAQRASPAILYFPHVDKLLLHLSDTARHCVISLITQTVSNPTAQVLILATSSLSSLNQSDDFPDWSNICQVFIHNTLYLSHPELHSRREYFSPLFTTLPFIPPPSLRNQKRQKLLEKWHSEVLPVAPPPPPRKLTKEELRLIVKEEDSILRELRMSLRQLVASLARDLRFKVFLYPVDQEDVPDYYEIIKQPMDLSQIKTNIDLHLYTGLSDFMKDIEVICLNALEYNPVTEIKSREIRHRACDLRDTAIDLAESLVDADLIQRCQNVLDARAQRDTDGLIDDPPNHIHIDSRATKSNSSQNKRERGMDRDQPVDYLAGPTRLVFTPYHHKDQSRFSKRLMGESAPLFSTKKKTKKARKSDCASSHQEDAADSQVSDNKLENEIDQKEDIHKITLSPRSTRSKSLSPMKSLAENPCNGEDIDGEPVTKSKLPTKNLPSSPKSSSPVFTKNDNKDNSPCNVVKNPLAFNGDDDSSVNAEKSNGSEVTIMSDRCEISQSSVKTHEDIVPCHLTNGDCFDDTTSSFNNNNRKERVLIMNKEMLVSQLEKCVDFTNQWSVSQLEELYVALACCLNHYKNSWDRTALNNDYDGVLLNFF